MIDFNSELDLKIEREAPFAPELFWQAWTTPNELMPWYCPKPWLVTECEIDLVPGGIFRTVMQGPDGEKINNIGSYLQVIPNQKLVWTNAFGPGFRPNPIPAETAGPNFLVTVELYFQSTPTGTRFIGIAKHATAKDRQTHADMGFDVGWGIVFDQLCEILAGKSQG